VGGPTWKITNIALNNLGAWLQLQKSMSMVKNVWQSLSGQSKPGKDIVLETLSQTSVTGGQLGECSGVDIRGGVEDCLEEPQSFPCLTQCSRLVSEQGVQSAVFLSSLLIKFHPCPMKKHKEKQRNMDSILYIIENCILKLAKQQNKTTKRPHLLCSILGLLNTNKM
jgi:hypothetical protein